MGGASGSREVLTGASLFGGSFIFLPVRGYPRSARHGRYAWTASAEYRLPLALVNRGLGAWPLHIDRLAGALFMDAGNAWGTGAMSSAIPNPLQRAITSIGAEATAEMLGRYDIQLRLRTGLALPLVGGHGARVYLRLGLPF